MTSDSEPPTASYSCQQGSQQAYITALACGYNALGVRPGGRIGSQCPLPVWRPVATGSRDHSPISTDPTGIFEASSGCPKRKVRVPVMDVVGLIADPTQGTTCPWRRQTCHAPRVLSRFSQRPEILSC